MRQANLDCGLWKEMLKNAIMREIMEGNLLQDRHEHGERDLKKIINLLTTITLEILWKRKIYVFCGSKRVLASVHGPKGRKGGQGYVDCLLYLIYITIQPAMENANGSNLLNHQKQSILN